MNSLSITNSALIAHAKPEPGQERFVSAFMGFSSWEPPAEARTVDYVSQAQFVANNGLSVVGQVGNTILVTQPGYVERARSDINEALALLNSMPVGATLVRQLYDASTPKLLFMTYGLNPGPELNYTRWMQNFSQRLNPNRLLTTYPVPDGKFRSNSHIVSWSPQFAPHIPDDSRPGEYIYYAPPVVTLAHELGHLRGIQEDFSGFAYRLRTNFRYLEENGNVLRNYENPILETLGFPARVYGPTDSWRQVDSPVQGIRP